MPISLVVDRAPDRFDIAGGWVTLNVAKMPFLQIDDFYLSFNHVSACVPIGKSPEFYARIIDLLDKGVLIHGQKSQEQPKATFADIDEATSDEEIHKAVLTRVSKTNVALGNRYKVVYQCLEHEILNQCRKFAIDAIYSITKRVYGPQIVTRVPEGQIQISKEQAQWGNIVPGGDEPLDL